jgi:Tfp pilus assembly protein PilN
MIQFNLLPDVKLEYIKARRLKRSVVLISGLVVAASLTLLIIMFVGVVVFQKKHMNDLSADIKTDKSKLESVQDLDKILTVQNQLGSLPALHDQKPVTSRLFTYLPQLTPQQASISDLTLDFDAQTLSVKGTADTISTINKFVDTLKFTDMKIGDEQKRAFSAVVLSTFDRTDKASYEITFKFEPAIFDSKNDVSLVVPNIISTRSETEKPEPLFQQQGAQ